ncbi:hypothetical protein D1816_14895 [Aquimarina sp. AD10]|uniref:Type IX secretion system protein PorV domain-containing protein n=1 Tax=Aquimarina aggregata TaxID=1642818 RepID=A0A162WIG9_9FLAO|nr:MULTISPECIES: PorV/PorQ family protein [Aquimarina]AXT61582.1 hypothetical protein D1816_14895 [Aquimarina sp. AD10]KZS38123.1 hypothetical protein AWE51_18945 [Aquimarina aggregata]RKM90066.1 hypothetical protein D7033_25415 [Aquimarina sp. AD10]
MKESVFIFALISFYHLSAQRTTVSPLRDSFISIATDARSSGQGDIGVATSADAFSQLWNPSKYMFSNKKFELGITQILGGGEVFNEFNQLNLSFYNKLNFRSTYSLSIRGYAYTIRQFQLVEVTYGVVEVSIDGSYTLRLSDTFAMSVGGRYFLLGGKEPLANDFDNSSNLYGIDVSGFYYGKEIAYTKFNGRWRAGFNFSNLRGESFGDNKAIEIYAPSTVRVGTGFDFIINQDEMFSITTEYKTLLDSYVEDANGENLEFGLTGSVIALGLEFVYKEKIMTRTGYSHGINRLTDSFATIGLGFQGKYVVVDVAYLLGLSEEENPVRKKLRVSLSLNLEEVL